MECYIWQLLVIKNKILESVGSLLHVDSNKDVSNSKVLERVEVKTDESMVKELEAGRNGRGYITFSSEVVYSTKRRYLKEF